MRPLRSGGGALPRDQARSPFTAILERLVDSTPGALGAALADDEGETVDYHGALEADDLRLSAAHMGIILDHISSLGSIAATGRLLEVRVVARDAQYLARPVGPGYQVTVILEPVALLPRLARALDRALVEVRVEAGGALEC
jgi:predicted regulator of Ras-like GTPase activity (Roadblock/LC7/MglB family)